MGLSLHFCKTYTDIYLTFALSNKHITYQIAWFKRQRNQIRKTCVELKRNVILTWHQFCCVWHVAQSSGPAQASMVQRHGRGSVSIILTWPFIFQVFFTHQYQWKQTTQTVWKLCQQPAAQAYLNLDGGRGGSNYYSLQYKFSPVYWPLATAGWVWHELRADRQL